MVQGQLISYHDDDGLGGGHEQKSVHDEVHDVHGDVHDGVHDVHDVHGDVHDVLKLEMVQGRLIFCHDGDGGDHDGDHGGDGDDDGSVLDLHLASPPQKRKQKPLIKQQPEKRQIFLSKNLYYEG